MPTDLTQLEIPDDSSILEAWYEPYGLAATTVADELNLFEAIAQGSTCADELAHKIGIAGEGCLALGRVLVSNGLLDEPSELTFTPTPLALAYWLKSSPLYRGLEFHRIRASAAHQRLLDALRQHGRDNRITGMWEQGEVDAAQAEQFTALMHSIMLGPAIAEVRSGAFEGFPTVIDAGGGSGAFCAALVAHQPEVEAIVMDLSEVCSLTQGYVARYVGEGRVKTTACNFFKDRWPTAGAYHFSNILHDWPLEVAGALLKRAFEALPSGGSVFVHEVLLDEGKSSPRTAVIFNLLMYINHRSQQFTFRMLQEMLTEAGFRDVRTVHTFAQYTLLRADKP